MNIRSLWVKLALLLSMVVLFGVSIPSTLAYITTRTPDVVNDFYVDFEPQIKGTQVEIAIEKLLSGKGAEAIGPGGFSFLLEDTLAQSAQTVKTDENGHASIVLDFAGTDADKTYTYRLSEINDARPGVIYSDMVYEIVVKLTANEHNELEAAVAMNGKALLQPVALFENTYVGAAIAGVGDIADIPDTGDHTSLALCVAMLMFSTTGIVVLNRGKKRSLRG